MLMEDFRSWSFVDLEDHNVLENVTALNGISDNIEFH